MKRLLLLITLIIIAGCATVEIPEWRFASFNQLENFKNALLTGKRDSAELHFQKAVAEINKSGDINILARAQLTRCALHAALLQAIPVEDYLLLENLSPMPDNRQFLLFLRGDFHLVDPNRIPEQYRDSLRAIRQGGIKEVQQALLKIENDLSRLITVGLVVRYGSYNEAILQTAIDTASKNGWKGALMVYLAAMQHHHEKQNEPEKAARVEKLMKLIQQ